MTDSTRISEIKTKYGLAFTNKILSDALRFANNQMLRNVCVNDKGDNIRTIENNVIRFKNYPYHKDLTVTTTVDNFEVYERDLSFPFTKHDLKPNVVNTLFPGNGYGYLVFDGQYPSTGREFVVQYYQTLGDLRDEEVLFDYKTLQEYYVLLYLFRNMSVHQLQRGITDNSVNGVSIRFDKSSVDDFVKQLRSWIQELILRYYPLSSTFSGESTLFHSVSISKRYD